MAPRAAVPAAAARPLRLLVAGLTALLVLGLAGCGNGVVPAGPSSLPPSSLPPSSVPAPVSPSVSPSVSSSVSSAPGRVSSGAVTPTPVPSGTGGSSPGAASPTADRSPSTGSSTGRPSRSSDRPSTSTEPTASATASGSPSEPPGTSTGPSATSSDQSSPSTTSSATQRGTGLRRTCALADVEIGVIPAAGGGAAGSSYVLLTFGNHSASTCWMYGYPGVSFVGGGNGTQLGAAATRTDPADVQMVRVGPGRRTTAVLQIADAGDYDESTCVPTKADGLRVYPPASLTAAYVEFPAVACAGPRAKQLTVSPVGTTG